MDFGSTIAQLRERRGLSQAVLAKQLSISQATLAMYETNQRRPNIEMLANIASYFKVTTDFLLGRSADAVKDDIHNEFDLLLDDINTHIKQLTQADKEMIHSLARAYLQNKEKIHLDFE